jgi:outer membrane protein assembly factor BamB
MKKFNSYLILCSLSAAMIFFTGCGEDEEDIFDTKPVAAFSVNAEEVEVGDVIIFTDLSYDQNGTIESWLWDFGDGSTSTEQSPTHEYVEGEYMVTLVVTDNSGKLSENDFSKTITVLEPSTVTIEPTIIWDFQLPAKIEDSSPAISSDGTVYIGCRGKEGLANVFAVKDGVEQWQFETGDIVRSAPAIDEAGNIYLGSYDNHLYGFDPQGNVIMKFDMGNNAKYSGPVFGLNGEIYIGCQTDELIAVDKGGNELWRYDTGGDVNSTPAVGSDGSIYVGSTGDLFFAFNPDGSVKWSKEFGSWTATATALGEDGTVYFAGEGNNLDATFGGVLIAYEPNTGNEKWRTGLTGKVNQGGPAISPDGVLYVGGHDQKLFAFNTDNGSLLWEYEVNGNILAVPAIDNDGNIYITDDSGYLHVIAPDGSKKWKEIQLGVKIWSSPTIGPNGTIYIAADQADDTGVLYALQTNATGLAEGGWPMRSKNERHTGR